METKKTKTKRIIAGVLAFVLIGFILMMVNQFVGNPLSRMLVNRSAEKYLAENYRDLDLEAEKADYDFKTGRYYVAVKSNTSIDTHFDMGYTWAGKFDYDGYEDIVLSKWNTWQRVDKEYSDLVEDKIESKMNFKEREFMYGEIKYADDKVDSLEIDKLYNIKELAKIKGHIIVHMERKERDAEVMTEILLNIKSLFDGEKIPFYQIGIDLRQPRMEDDNGEEIDNSEEEDLSIENFSYEDIYVEGLEKRVEKNIEETRKYYKEEDKKQKEIDEYEEDLKDAKKDKNK